MVWLTLAKNIIVVPISNRVRREAAVSPRFHNIMIRLGQWRHATKGKIQPITEEESLKVAGDFIGHAGALTVVAALANRWRKKLKGIKETEKWLIKAEAEQVMMKEVLSKKWGT